jgi:hypothetical protein
LDLRPISLHRPARSLVPGACALPYPAGLVHDELSFLRDRWPDCANWTEPFQGRPLAKDIGRGGSRWVGYDRLGPDYGSD